MPAHSRPKNGDASLAYVAGIHVLKHHSYEDVDGRDKPGHDVLMAAYCESTLMFAVFTTLAHFTMSFSR
jgi:hypothetical protein